MSQAEFGHTYKNLEVPTFSTTIDPPTPLRSWQKQLSISKGAPGQTYCHYNHIAVRESKYLAFRDSDDRTDLSGSDYKDDGTNILLDANENAYGPGLALDGQGRLSAQNGAGHLNESVDLIGLNRYPDP